MSLMTPRCSLRALDRPAVWGGFEPLAELVVLQLQAFPMAVVVAAQLADQEAEASREQHP